MGPHPPSTSINQRNAQKYLELVGAAGLEPARPYGQQILSLLRLPVSPRPHTRLGHDVWSEPHSIPLKKRTNQVDSTRGSSPCALAMAIRAAATSASASGSAERATKVAP